MVIDNEKVSTVTNNVSLTLNRDNWIVKYQSLAKCQKDKEYFPMEFFMLIVDLKLLNKKRHADQVKILKC